MPDTFTYRIAERAMRSEEESARFEATCRRLEAELSPEERAHLESTVLEFARALQTTDEYEKDLLKRLGVRANLDDREEFYLRLWAAGRNAGISTKEFWEMTPREFCAVLELKVREFELLSGPQNRNCIEQPTIVPAASGQTGPSAAPQPPVVPEEEGAAYGLTRRELVDAFLAKCNEVSTVRIFRAHIWRFIGHKHARQFEYWQAGDDRRRGTTHGATEQDDHNIRRVLSMRPEEFLLQLRQRGLLAVKS